MFRNIIRDDTLEPAYFARIANGGSSDIDEQRIKDIEKKNQEQDTKLSQLEKDIEGIECKCDMSPIENSFINGLTFSWSDD